MAIEFNVKPHLGYYGSKVKIIKKDSTITIIPSGKDKTKNVIIGMSFLLIPIFTIGTELVTGFLTLNSLYSMILFFVVALVMLPLILNGDRIIEIDRQNLEIRTKSYPIPITKPRISKIVDFHGIGCRDKQYKVSRSSEGSSYTTTHSVKEIFLLTANGHIPVLFIEGLELGTKLAIEISEKFKIDFEDDIILEKRLFDKSNFDMGHPGYPNKQYGLEAGDEVKSKVFALFYNLVIISILGLIAFYISSVQEKDSFLQNGIAGFCGSVLLIMLISTIKDIITGKRIYVRPKHGGIVARDKIIQGAPFGKGLISKIYERSFRKELNESMNEYELDEEGRISKDNFIKLLSKELPNWEEFDDSSDQIKGNENKIFTLLDKDKDGFIDADSIIDFLFNMENYVNKLEPENAPPTWWSSNEEE